MVDKKDNIKAIRKGITIASEDKPKEVSQQLVETIEQLLVSVKAGEYQEVCFVAVGEDTTTARAMAGYPAQPFIMSAQLELLSTLYKEEVVNPILLPPDYYFEDMED